MLMRRDGDGRIAIAQPAHAALSGRLAAAWGDAAFPAPRPEAVLAAALHDVGWAAWEREPARDPATGWPRTFPQVSPLVHVELWRDGIALAQLFGRRVALLVSRHADTIYSRHFDPAAASQAERTAVRAFLDEQHAVQADLAGSLRADPLADDVSDEAIERDRLFVATVDELSLRLCWGVDAPVEIAEVPAAGSRTATLSLQPAGENRVAVSPWPFASPILSVAVEGRRLAAPSSSDEALARDLAAAPVVTVAAELVPG